METLEKSINKDDLLKRLDENVKQMEELGHLDIADKLKKLRDLYAASITIENSN